MGYLMQQVDSDFFVPVDEKRLAYEAVFRYMDSDDAGDFMWVDILMLWDAKTLEDQFAAWRWSTSTDEAAISLQSCLTGRNCRTMTSGSCRPWPLTFGMAPSLRCEARMVESGDGSLWQGIALNAKSIRLG